MIAEAINRIRELTIASETPQLVDANGRSFSTQPLHPVPNKPVAKPDVVKHSTLRSLVSYLTDNPDQVEDLTFLSVVSPTEVKVLSPTLGEDLDRQEYSAAVAQLPSHRFGQYMRLEDFGIYVRTCFVQTEERDALVALVAGVVDASEIETQDDGVTQTVQMKKGLSMVKEGETPGVVRLQPFRTFHDVDHPESPFVLRLQRGHAGPEAALFTADGEAWRHEATQNVAVFLEEALGDSFSVFA